MDHGTDNLVLIMVTIGSFLCMSQQGALTHGDRRATETRDLSRYNFDNKVGSWRRVDLGDQNSTSLSDQRPG